MRRARAGVGAAIAWFFACASALAQVSTGTLQGTIVDAAGQPLAGVTVVVESPTHMGKLTGKTDARGVYRFIGLTPGAFSLEASRQDLAPEHRTDILVGLDRTTALDLVLEAVRPKGAKEEAAPQAEEMVVVAQRFAVDTEKPSAGASVPMETLEELPTRSRNYQGVAQDVAGVSGGANPNIRGGTLLGNTYLVDGVDITDPTTHTFGTNFNYDAMANVDVKTAGYGPEYSSTTGGVIKIVTKSGSNELHVDASGYFTDDLFSIQRDDEKGQTFRDASLNLNLSGPLRKDALWMFGSLQYDDRVAAIPDDPNGLLPRHPERHFNGYQYLAKATWRPLSGSEFVFQGQGSAASIDNTLQLITVEPDAEAHQDQTSLVLSTEYSQDLSEDVLWRTQLSYRRIGLDVFPQSGDRATPGVGGDIDTGVASINYTRIVDDVRNTLAVDSDVTQYIDSLFGDHRLRYGVKYAHSWNPITESVPGGRSFVRDGGEEFSQTLSCIEFDPETLACTHGKLSVETSGDTALLFAEEGWTLPFYDQLTVAPGVGGHWAVTRNFAGEKVSDFLTATPHANLTWRPIEDSPTVVRAGYNQYVDLGFLAIAAFVGRSFFTRQCEIDPAVRDAGAQDPYVRNCINGGGESGVTVGYPNGPPLDQDGEPIDTTNPDALRVPRTHEFHLGAEHEVLKGLAVGVDGVYRLYTHQWEDVETNVLWNELGSDAVDFRNGRSELVYDLQTPDEAQRTHFSASLFANKYVGQWKVLSSYTFTRSRGTANEGFATPFLDNARQTKFYEGPLSDDRTHTVKLSGSYTFLDALTVGGTFFLATGAPYDRLFLNDLFNAYVDRRAPRGSDPGDLSDPDDDRELRMPTMTQLDLKLAYNFHRLTVIDVEGIIEIFNVYNARTPTRLEERDFGPAAPAQFEEVLDRQDPFQARLGVRVRY